MVIQNDFAQPPLTRETPHCYISRGGERSSRTEAVLTEHTIHIFGQELVCLPQFLPELVLGHLMTEGLIAGAQDVERIHIDVSGEHAAVALNNDAATRALQSVTAIRWKPDWIFSLADRFARGMPLHGQTFATHSCFLAKGDQLLFQCEDIGRHNALDKAVGFALRNGIELWECILYSSGRMPVDMVSKAIRAGIPILVSKGSPTAGAVELAGKYGLTLICAARQDRMKQYTQ